MTETWLAALRTELDEIAGRLEAPGSEREAVKRDIISLFKRVDTALVDLAQIKESIRGLVERYKHASSSADTAPSTSAFFPSTASKSGRSSRATRSAITSVSDVE